MRINVVILLGAQQRTVSTEIMVLAVCLNLLPKEPICAGEHFFSTAQSVLQEESKMSVVR